jgi:hypothetical protein
MNRSLTTSSSVGLIIALIGAALMIGCNSPSNKLDKAQYEVSEARKDLLDAQEDYKKQVAIFKEESAQKISENEQKIANFSLKNEDSIEKKLNTSQKLISFEQKNEELKMRMTTFEANEIDKWEAFKAELDHDIAELGLAIRDFANSNDK